MNDNNFLHWNVCNHDQYTPRKKQETNPEIKKKKREVDRQIKKLNFSCGQNLCQSAMPEKRRPGDEVASSSTRPSPRG